MYEIIDKKILHENLKQIIVKAPLIAKHAKPGQFVIVMVDERGERIPITIADYDREKGTITLIFLEIGTSTKKRFTATNLDHANLNTGFTVISRTPLDPSTATLPAQSMPSIAFPAPRMV